jgi:pseudouridine synthase
MTAEPGQERLHKMLAHAGVASRRKCEDLIREGRVRVNGAIVKEMGVLVDPARDVVQVDDQVVKRERPVHLLLYKPRDYLCTTSDQFGRKTVLDLLPERRRSRMFTVGRLDYESEGLVVVTNDGDFAHELLHPKRRLPRTYYVKVRGHLTPELIKRAREGVWLSDGRTPPMDVRLLRAGRDVSTVKCTLVERHHHQLRRIWAKLGLPVLRLVLIRIASVGTEDLKKGAVRPLTAAEVEDLRNGPPGRLPGGDEPAPDRGRRGTRDARERRTAFQGPGKTAGGWGAPAEGDAREKRRRPGAREAGAQGGRGRRGARPPGRGQRGSRPASDSSSAVRFRKRGR